VNPVSCFIRTAFSTTAVALLPRPQKLVGTAEHSENARIGRPQGDLQVRSTLVPGDESAGYCQSPPRGSCGVKETIHLKKGFSPNSSPKTSKLAPACRFPARGNRQAGDDKSFLKGARGPAKHGVCKEVSPGFHFFESPPVYLTQRHWISQAAENRRNIRNTTCCSVQSVPG
jgi:hypothetical protein